MFEEASASASTVVGPMGSVTQSWMRARGGRPQALIPVAASQTAAPGPTLDDVPRPGCCIVRSSLPLASAHTSPQARVFFALEHGGTLICTRRHINRLNIPETKILWF